MKALTSNAQRLLTLSVALAMLFGNYAQLGAMKKKRKKEVVPKVELFLPWEEKATNKATNIEEFTAKTTTLDLHGQALTKQDIKNLVDKIEYMKKEELKPQLEVLNLSDCKIGMTNFDKLVWLFRRFKNLSELNLSNNGLTKNFGDLFPRVIDTMENLQILDLSNNSLNNPSLITANSYMPRLRKLIRLDLSNNCLGDDRYCAEEFNTRVFGDLGSLSTLDLSKNNLEQEAIEKIKTAWETAGKDPNGLAIDDQCKEEPTFLNFFKKKK
jgi:Ran GTPase-activating protein (RanGAP) involved in mRNA processing and transport